MHHVKEINVTYKLILAHVLIKYNPVSCENRANVHACILLKKNPILHGGDMVSVFPLQH